jgi:hypothetical protein
MSAQVTNLGIASDRVYLIEDHADAGSWPGAGSCKEVSTSVAMSVLETDLTYDTFPISGGFWVEAIDSSGPNGTPLPAQVMRNYPNDAGGWSVDVMVYADDVAERYDTSTFTDIRLHIYGHFIVHPVYHRPVV